MATIKIADGNLVIEMHGMDKFWALSGSLTIPLAHVKNVEVRPKDAHITSRTKAIRVGSYIPGVVLAGYYYMLDGVGANAAAVFESLERCKEAIEAWPRGDASTRDASHRDKALDHIARATDEMKNAASEQGVDPADKGRGWAFYELHDAEKTIGFDVTGEKIRRVVIQIDGMTPEQALELVESARKKTS